VCCIIKVARLPFSTAQLQIVEIVILAVHVIITLPTTIGIVGLFGYQVWCLIGNVTSVETFSRARYRRAALKREENFTWFYDFGWCYNIKQVAPLFINNFKGTGTWSINLGVVSPFYARTHQNRRW